MFFPNTKLPFTFSLRKYNSYLSIFWAETTMKNGIIRDYINNLSLKVVVFLQQKHKPKGVNVDIAIKALWQEDNFGLLKLAVVMISRIET